MLEDFLQASRRRHSCCCLILLKCAAVSRRYPIDGAALDLAKPLRQLMPLEYNHAVRPSRSAQPPRPSSTRAKCECDQRRTNVAQKGRLNGLNLANEPFARSIL